LPEKLILKEAKSPQKLIWRLLVGVTGLEPVTIPM